MSDDSLLSLFASEIRRHLGALGTDPSASDLRHVLHAIRGSAALVQNQDLALVASQLGGRLRAGDEAARHQTIDLLHRVEARMRQGQPAFTTTWPEPPPELMPSRVSPELKKDYVAAMNDRLRDIDGALDRDDPVGSLHHAYRTVHMMKSMAMSANDEVTAWYCHGLETRLKELRASETTTQSVLGDLARHRAVIAQFVEQPARALETLRAVHRAPATPTPLPPRPSSYPPPAAALDGDATLRIPTAVIDHVIEQLGRAHLVNDELLRAAAAARAAASQLRERRSEVLDGLRDFVATKGVGHEASQRVDRAARSLTNVADGVEQLGHVCRRNAQVLTTSATKLHADIAALRRTTARSLFARVRTATKNLTPAGQQVRVEMDGADLSLDRPVADGLLEPVLQLTRNAVAHGLEPPHERRRAGKPETGTILLRATRLGGWIRIVVEDDGRGVDLSKLRTLAAERGLVGAEEAAIADDDAILAVLFLPGVTTRQGADLLGGRGVGLELAQHAVRALGGTIRLATRPRSGLVATIDVPAERGLTDVLWVEVSNTTIALPTSSVSEVVPATTKHRCVPLAECLGLEFDTAPQLAVGIAIHGIQAVSLGVDTASLVESALVRPIPPLVVAAGPFGGAVLRSDGSLRLVLDPELVAARACAHAS